MRTPAGTKKMPLLSETGEQSYVKVVKVVKVHATSSSASPYDFLGRQIPGREILSRADPEP